MKMILDLKEDTIKALNENELETNLTINEQIDLMVKEQLIEPNKRLDIASKDDIENFMQVMFEYVNEAIHDIEGLAKSDVAEDDDKKIIESFKVLNREIMKDKKMLSMIFEAYNKK